MEVHTDFFEASHCAIESLATNRVRCRLISERSGSQTFHFCVRLDGLADGRLGELEIVWPRVWTAADLPADANAETVSRMTGHDSFLSVLPRVTLRSRDLDTWTPIEGVRIDEASDTAVVPLVGDGKPIYVCTQIPYRPDHYTALLDHVRRLAPECLHEIGRSQATRPLYVVALPATSGEPSEAPTVYIQALQHHGEHSGGFIVNTLLRDLLDATTGGPLRERVNWQIMPMFDVDGFHGLAAEADDVRRKNPNRDWDVADWPEVAAVKRWWHQQRDAGCRYAVCFDLHNGWSHRNASGACYTVFADDEAPPALIAEQKRFIDSLYARTDHETGKHWAHKLPFGLSCKHAFYELTGAPLSFTVEFSRHLWWDRPSRAYVPARPDHPVRWARDMAPALVAYLTANG
ncbi:MAG: M14 family zinc carboxypeptidase [Planctomycetota bacterium]